MCANYPQPTSPPAGQVDNSFQSYNSSIYPSGETFDKQSDTEPVPIHRSSSHTKIDESFYSQGSQPQLPHASQIQQSVPNQQSRNSPLGGQPPQKPQTQPQHQDAPSSVKSQHQSTTSSGSIQGQSSQPPLSGSISGTQQSQQQPSTSQRPPHLHAHPQTPTQQPAYYSQEAYSKTEEDDDSSRFRRSSHMRSKSRDDGRKSMETFAPYRTRPTRRDQGSWGMAHGMQVPYSGHPPPPPGPPQAKYISQVPTYYPTGSPYMNITVPSISSQAHHAAVTAQTWPPPGYATPRLGDQPVYMQQPQWVAAGEEMDPAAMDARMGGYYQQQQQHHQSQLQPPPPHHQQHFAQHPPPQSMTHGSGQRSRSPQLIRTSALAQTRSSWTITGYGNYEHGNNAPMNVREQASLSIDGSLDTMTKGWTLEEELASRRLVLFSRIQEGSSIRLKFEPISRESYNPQTTVISCIYWKEKQEYYVTSVDCITLLELIINQKFTVEEKNRVRRNLEVCKPLTVSKTKNELTPFFQLIMKFEPPRPRNIEKDVKVFAWSMLGSALKKIVGKYSASYMNSGMT